MLQWYRAIRGALLTVSALLYLGATVMVGLFVAVVGALGCGEGGEGCPEFEDRTRWWHHRGAWQWDAIALLGLAGGVAGLVCFALALVARRPALPRTALGVQAAFLLAASPFLLPALDLAPSYVAFWFTVIAGSGAAFIYLKASRHADGTRRE